MKVELHILQNFAPSCLNRDDTNAPKDCEFGGYRRARISSQCIKRAMRTQFLNTAMPTENLAVRTKLLVNEKLVPLLVNAGKDAGQSRLIAEFVLRGLGLGVSEDSGTEYLVFLGNQETQNIVRLIQEHWDDLAEAAGARPESGEEAEKTSRREAKKAGRQALQANLRKAFLNALDGGKAADLAMFGRMVADLPERNIDAACQVAHAISTHAVSEEIDFFTAVDDLQPKAETGAGMMGVVEFNSACFYRYTLIDMKQLTDNLNGDEDVARQAVQALLQAAVQAIPTGKQNTFAAHNPPSLVFAVVRESGAPWSLANAFVDPVRPSAKSDLITSSVERLDSYWSRMVAGYGSKGIKKGFVCLLHEAELEHLKAFQVDSVDALIAGVGEAIR